MNAKSCFVGFCTKLQKCARKRLRNSYLRITNANKLQFVSLKKCLFLRVFYNFVCWGGRFALLLQIVIKWA